MPVASTRRSLSAARYPSNSRRWAAASCIAVLLLSAALIVSLWNKIEAYNAGYAAATPGASATVVRSEHFTKRSDVIEVEWHDHNGELRRHEFDVNEASDFPVGSTLPIRVSATVPGQIYPDDRTRIDETAPPTVGLVVLVVAALGTSALWIRRAVQWRRAVRAPAKRHRAQLWYSHGRGNVVDTPWLTIADGDRTYYQRLMWEPWVPSINEDLVIEGRRVGRGPFVVDVPGFGRLWPAGPAKHREPWLESLDARRSSRYRRSRFSTLIVLSLLIVLLTGVLAGWLGSLAIAGYLWLLILYVGGAATPVPLLRPRRYRRIHGPGLASGADAPTVRKPRRRPRPTPKKPRSHSR